MRVVPLALVALFLATAFPAPPAAAAASTPAAYGFEEIETFYTGSRITLREIAWHPSGDYALIAGGVRGPATDPMGGWESLLKYDNRTGAVTPILNASARPMLFAVKFAPDGSHALVIGEKDTILRYDHATGEVRNLFAELQASALAADPTAEPPIFQGRGLAYNPRGFAVITGQEILFYSDGAGLFRPGDASRPIKPEGGGYFKAIAFAPDGSYGIVEGGDTYPDTDPQGRGGQARIGQLWFLGLTEDRCARYGLQRAVCLLKFAVPYGYFDPNRADASDITFHPVINASFVYGYDDKYGSILRIRDNGTAPDEPQPKADYVPEWMSANHKGGKYTDMEFRPHGTRALVTAFGDPTLMEFDGLSIRTILDPDICQDAFGHPCPTFESIGWHPSGAYAVVVGLYGSMIKVTPQPTPEVSVTAPTEAQTVIDEGQSTLVVAGTAYATVFGTKIKSVRVAVDNGTWNEADFSTRFNPVNWRWRWNVSSVAPGPHTLTVEAEDTAGHVSSTVNVTVYVALPPPPLDAPVFNGTNLTSRLGDFVLTWEPVAGAVAYVVQDSRDPAFLNKVTWPVDAPQFESLARDNGTYYFRVAATGAPRPDSPWSGTFVVNVTEGRARAPPTAECERDPAACIDEQIPPPPEEDDPPVDNGTPPDEQPPEDDPTNDTPPRQAPTPAAGLAAVLVGVGLAVAARRRR